MAKTRPLFTTTDALVNLFPLIAHQEWSYDDLNSIRNVKGECPLCALFAELGNFNINYYNKTNVISAFKLLTGRTPIAIEFQNINAITYSVDTLQLSDLSWKISFHNKLKNLLNFK